jgi:oligoribonuclease (3'-5' exoribonuclease)
MIGHGHIGKILPVEREYAPLEKHVAESKWQFCNCQSCQDRRFLLDSLPGTKIDYATYRHKDEKY